MAKCSRRRPVHVTLSDLEALVQTLSLEQAKLYNIPQCKKIIEYLAKSCYYGSNYELRARYELQDLVGEGFMVLVKCAQHYRKKSAAKFNTYFTNALRIHYLRIVRENMCQKRDTRVEVVSIPNLSNYEEIPEFAIDEDPQLRRVELQIDLQSARTRVSRDGVALIDYICELSTLSTKRSKCVRGELTVKDISKRLRVNSYRARQMVDELRQALGRG